MSRRTPDDRKTINLNREEVRFLRFLRDFGWGKIEVIVKDGKPVQASVVRRDFRFDHSNEGEIEEGLV